MPVNYTSGLNFSDPSKGDTDWDTTEVAKSQKISAHDHTGGGKGLQIATAALAADSVTETKIRLANNAALRARNAANSADVNLFKLDTSNITELLNVFALSSTQTVTTSTALSLLTTVSVLNGASLAVTLAAGTVEGQVKVVVNTAATIATVTPAAGGPACKLEQNGSCIYVYSGVGGAGAAWQLFPGRLAFPVVTYLTPITRLKSAALGLTTATAVNLCATPSLTLTPGDWQITAGVGFTFGATTSVTNLQAAVSKTTGTLSGTDTISVPTASEFRAAVSTAANVMVSDTSLVIPPYRTTVSTSTDIFLVVAATFTVSTCAAYGWMEATRLKPN